MLGGNEDKNLYYYDCTDKSMITHCNIIEVTCAVRFNFEICEVQQNPVATIHLDDPRAVSVAAVMLRIVGRMNFTIWSLKNSSTTWKSVNKDGLDKYIFENTLDGSPCVVIVGECPQAAYG